MTQRVSFDFSRLATLSHALTGTAAFDAVSELGRAQATVGAADAATRISASRLGAEANGITYLVWGMGGAASRVEVDGRAIRVGIATGATAADVAAALNLNPRDPRRVFVSYRADNQTEAVRAIHPGQGAQGAYTLFGADVAGGTGADPVTLGSATLAGGADPSVYGNNAAQFTAATGHGGLFVFDHDEPLVLVQFMAELSSSVAWTLTLRPLTPARGDLGIGHTITGATSQNPLVTNQPVVIPPGWGVGFSASAQGSAFVMVRRA